MITGQHLHNTHKMRNKSTISHNYHNTKTHISSSTIEHQTITTTELLQSYEALHILKPWKMY